MRMSILFALIIKEEACDFVEGVYLYLGNTWNLVMIVKTELHCYQSKG